MAELTAGQKVTIYRNRDLVSITTVAKIGKAKLVMADGSEWKTKSGQPWGQTYSFNSRRFREWREGDEAALETRKNLELVDCSYRAWREYSAERLARIAAVIREHEAEKRAAKLLKEAFTT